MATKINGKPTKRPRQREGFDVVCTIGRVEFDALADQHPHVAAFALIGEHTINGGTGVFTFPHETGGTVAVTVEYEGGGPEVRQDDEF